MLGESHMPDLETPSGAAALEDGEQSRTESVVADDPPVHHAVGAGVADRSSRLGPPRPGQRATWRLVVRSSAGVQRALPPNGRAGE
jgi:hypothetical protein